MTAFLRPQTWAEALEALQTRAGRTAAMPVLGGTEVMAEVNAGLRRPAALLDLSRIAALAEWRVVNGRVRIGAAVTYTRLIDELGVLLPGLAAAAATVGSQQIRNRGTLGGALGSASPERDVLPPLVADRAVVELESAARGIRRIPVTGLFPSGPRPDELIAAIWLPPAAGPQHFAKVGRRNAMSAAVCSFAVVLRPSERSVRTGLAAVAPTPRHAAQAEDYLSAHLDWTGRRALPPGTADRFAELVSAAAWPDDDLRASARYRRHALAVLARRTLDRAWHALRAENR